MNDDRRKVRARHRATPVVTAAAGLVAVGTYAWWAVGRAPFSGSATVAVLAAGVVAVGIGARRTPRAFPAGDATGIGWWVVLAVAAAVWQLAAYLQHPRHDHPTLSSLTNALLDSHLTRAGAFVLWLAGAAALARR